MTSRSVGVSSVSIAWAGGRHTPPTEAATSVTTMTSHGLRWSAAAMRPTRNTAVVSIDSAMVAR
jgi:hypothetical protein